MYISEDHACVWNKLYVNTELTMDNQIVWTCSTCAPVLRLALVINAATWQPLKISYYVRIVWHNSYF